VLRTRALLAATLLAVGTAAIGAASATSTAPVLGVDESCYAPAGDPEPGSAAFLARDVQNQYCAGLRLRDQVASPAFGFGNVTQGAALYAEQMTDQLARPTDPSGGTTTLVPGSKSADPFRTVRRWTEAGRGRVATVSFSALNDSSLFGSDCPGKCTGVPYQQDLNFYQGAEDSLSFFLSTPTAPFGGSSNPYAGDLDTGRIGLAGHSLGAAAISHVGQCDNRVKTIVAWDNLRQIESCQGIVIPKQYRTTKLINVPALALTNDYGFFTTPATTAPDPESKTAGYEQVRKAGLDAQIIALRGATHLTYSYIPLVFQANELGERMASYYTKAWFDLHLRGDRSGLTRLTATTFDGSVDGTSIGAGTYDPALADPADPYAGNVPHRIKGIQVQDAVSFYYRSSYSLGNGKRRLTCTDVRAGGPELRRRTDERLVVGPVTAAVSSGARLASCSNAVRIPGVREFPRGLLGVGARADG